MLVIAAFELHYSQNFPNFSYFAIYSMNEIAAKYDK